MSSSRGTARRGVGGAEPPTQRTLRRQLLDPQTPIEEIKDETLSSPTSPDPSPSQGRLGPSSSSSQPRKLTLPNCAVCKNPAKEPHAVYCCGAFYCHVCLVAKMTEAAKRGAQADCVSCGKPMGDPPKKRRLAGSATQASSEPPQKVLIRADPTGRIDPLAGLPRPFPAIGPRAEPNSIGIPSWGSSNPENWIPSLRTETFGRQPSSLSVAGGPNSLPVTSGPNSLGLPSIQTQETAPQRFQLPVLRPNLPTVESNQSQYRPYPGGRMTATSGRNAQNQKLMAAIGDVDEVLPKPPNVYEVEESRRIEQQMEKMRVKQEVVEPQEVKGPSCATCWESSTAPVSMHCCSAIFCKLCLHNSLRYKKRCPLCNRNFSHSATIATVSRLLQVQPAVKPVQLMTPLNGDFNVDLLTKNFDNLDEVNLNIVISRLTELREQKYKAARQESLRTISVGLSDMVKKNRYDIEVLTAKTKAAIQDKQFLDGGYTRESALYGGVTSVMSSSSSSGSSVPPTEETALTPQQVMKDDRLRTHFDAFTNAYHDIYQKFSPYTNENQTSMSLNRIGALAEVTDGITKYGNVKRIANLNYDCEPNPSMSIISSLEFDSTGERFVVAGVTKKIKIFDFNYFLNNPTRSHFPLGQLVCRSKISNISWSPDTRSLLASSDYDGHVSVWDIEKGKIVKSFQEHEKRCWTVHFSTVDPKIMASGSDDSKVKIWNVTCDRSVATIEAKVNVCCVYFSPEKEHQLVFGSADHCVHLYDIRQYGKPLSIFRGHRKAVSYVRYLDKDTVVSASTDSSLRVWNVNDGRCTKVLKGHVNEKNFVGLSSNGDHVMCGSENSRAFFYYKGLSDPLCTYTVGKDNAPEDDTEGFVSSVCWKKDSDHVLVANSLGKVHLLELS